jgi:hypothetical protein
MIETRYAFRILMRKPLGKHPLGRMKRKDNIKMVLRV